jgi:hypothetical protein
MNNAKFNTNIVFLLLSDLSGLFEESQERRQRLNSELADVAKHIAEVGPSINEVARRLQQHKESVRYRYHKFFLKKGITIQATPNYSRLGFTRLIVFAKLAPELESRANALFTSLSESCYLRSFTRTIIEHEYIIHVAVPKQLKQACSAEFKRFRDAGLFTECRIYEFEEFRNPPMKAEFYNFPDETWKFQWPEPGDEKPTFALKTNERTEKYDRFDLLILKELEIDANRRLVQISERVGVPARMLRFHYLNHVEMRNLVRAYRVSWPGSRYDFERGKTITRKDHYVEATILLEGANKSENAELRVLLNRLPFLWSEAVGPNYCAEVFVPNHLYIGFLEYLEDFAGRVGEKMKVLVMDQDRALRFTISYKLFDAETKNWRLDRDGVNMVLDDLIKSTRTVRSSQAAPEKQILRRQSD